MPEFTKFRLSDSILADLDSLAASFGHTDGRGHTSDAAREIITQGRMWVEWAARLNAAELTADEWTLLGHLQDPSGIDLPGEDAGPRACDWSRVIAMELVGVWEGRDATLPLHRDGAKASKALAKKVASWGPLRGYALMAALRYFWRVPEAGIEACRAPEVWMTPTAKE